MRFYLVLASLLSDYVPIVPIRLFTDRAEAMRFACRGKDILSEIDPEFDASWPSDYGEHFCNIVVDFENGRPVDSEWVPWVAEDGAEYDDGGYPLASWRLF
jgi:hypothetical protein